MKYARKTGGSSRRIHWLLDIAENDKTAMTTPKIIKGYQRVIFREQERFSSS